jgi:hypothetical protein
MGNPLAREAVEVGKERHDVGRGEPGRSLSCAVVTPSVPIEAAEKPATCQELAHHLHARGLAVGAGDGHHHIGHRLEEGRGQMGEQARGSSLAM